MEGTPGRVGAPDGPVRYRAYQCTRPEGHRLYEHQFDLHA